MKTLYSVLFTALLLTACGNGDSDEESNVLTDTLPAQGYPADSVAISIDSNPADATRVDSLAY